MEINDRGKTVPVKIGLAPVQRENTEYEFDLVMQLNREHIASISKDTTFLDNWTGIITPELGSKLKEWLDDGSEPERCSDCGQIIRPSKELSASDISEKSLNIYGRILCMDCSVQEKKKNEKKKKKAEDQSAAVNTEENIKQQNTEAPNVQ